MMECPNCWKGRIVGLSDSILCPICKGTNELPADVTYDPEKGRLLRENRLDYNYTLRTFCKRFGQDAVIRSEQERGFYRNE